MATEQDFLDMQAKLEAMAAGQGIPVWFKRTQCPACKRHFHPAREGQAYCCSGCEAVDAELTRLRGEVGRLSRDWRAWRGHADRLVACWDMQPEAIGEIVEQYRAALAEPDAE